jgi:putative inorganic carbon (HCO3(-)) transporter
MNVQERIRPVSPPPIFGPADIRFTERTTEGMSLAYKCVLVFLLLLYSNLPLLFPAAEAVRPAQLIALLAVATLVTELAFARRGFNPAWPEGVLVVCFLGAAALSSVSALWARHAAEAVSDMVKVVVLYFLIVNSAATERRLRGLQWTMVLGGLLPAFGTLRNYFQGVLVEGRAAWVGIFANPNEMAYSLVILVPLALFLSEDLGPLLRLGVLGILAVFAAAIFTTFSRGALLGLLVVLGLYAWRKRNIWLQIGLVVLVAAGLVVAQSFWTRDESFENLDQDLGAQQRLATIQAGLAMFLDRPLLGVGVGCSVIAWPLYAPEHLYSKHALANHNTFIQPLSETGILGFLPFATVVALGLYHARKIALQASKPGLARVGAGVEIALWGFVACGMTGGYALSWFPYILLAQVAAARRLAREP